MALKLKGSTSGFVGLDAPATAGNNTLILPENSGSAFQLFANDITAGVTTFTSVSVNRNGDLTVPGTISIGGTLTYEDVTSVDSVGIVTARGLSIFGNTTGLQVASGISTFQAVTATTGTFTGDVSIPDTIVHTGDTNTKIRFPAADTFTVETAGTEHLRVTSGGELQVTGGTGANVIINAATHDASTANQARLQLAYQHSGGQALGHLKLDEASTNSFDAIFRIGVPYNNGSGGSSTREVIEADFNGNIAIPGSTVSFDTTSRTAGLQLYYESDSGQATIGSYSGGGNTHLSLYTNASGGAATEKLRIESSGGIKIPVVGTSIPVGGILHHTNNNLYVRGGTSGLILGNQDSTNTIHISESDFIKFETTDGSERMRLDSSGRLLIGKTSGIATLDIDATNNAIRITKAAAGNYCGFRLDRDNSNTEGGYLGLSGAANHYINGSAQHDLCLRSQSNLLFSSNGTDEKMRLSTTGRLGIGENSPDTPLHVATGASTACEIRLTSNNTGSGSGDRGRLGVYSAKNDGTAFHAGYLDIDRASGTETTAQMTFNLNNGSGVTEHVRIEPKGRILAARNTSGDQGLMDPGVILDRQDTRVGTNSNTFNGVGIIKDSNGWGTALYIKRTSEGAGAGMFCEFAYASLSTSGTTIGSISNNGNSNVSFNTSSDHRLKQDISSITDAISSLKKLTPRKFRWKNDLDLGYQDGFIAHEVQETGIFSHLVTGEKDGTEEAKNDPDTIIPAYQQMDYSKLTPTLVAAVQELSAKIETLEAEIAALKGS